METIRIYDLKDGILAVDLKGLLRLLAPGSLETNWSISTVKSSKPGHEWFEATGEGGEQLEQLAQENARLSGLDLQALAENTRQVIWGEFIAESLTQPGMTWLPIRAVDSTFYEIDTDDKMALDRIRSVYLDIRTDEQPVASWPGP